MDKALRFLQSHKDVAFATVEDGKPRIRVFQIMRLEDTMLYFATSPRKEVYKQLRKNPKVELLSMEGNISVRLWGEVIFDVDETTAREIYSANPVLPRLYERYDDLVYFRLNLIGMDYFDLTTTPPLFEHFDI